MFAEIAKTTVGAAQSGRDYVDGLADKFVVKPKTAQGIGGFLFDYEGESTVQLVSDITDHFVEDNSPVHDHVATKPPRITLRGFVGELEYKAPAGIVGLLDMIQSKLTTVPAYLGKYTPDQLSKIQKAVTQTQSVVNQVDNALARAKNVVGMFPGMGAGKTKQEGAYKKLYIFWKNRTKLLVSTPYSTYDNMFIENLLFVQEEATKYWSDITVTLKQLTFVETKSRRIEKNANRTEQQTQSKADKGLSGGTPLATSEFKTAFPGLAPPSAFGQ